MHYILLGNLSITVIINNVDVGLTVSIPSMYAPITIIIVRWHCFRTFPLLVFRVSLRRFVACVTFQMSKQFYGTRRNTLYTLKRNMHCLLIITTSYNFEDLACTQNNCHCNLCNVIEVCISAAYFTEACNRICMSATDI